MKGHSRFTYIWLSENLAPIAFVRQSLTQLFRVDGVVEVHHELESGLAFSRTSYVYVREVDLVILAVVHLDIGDINESESLHVDDVGQRLQTDVQLFEIPPAHLGRFIICQSECSYLFV